MAAVTLTSLAVLITIAMVGGALGNGMPSSRPPPAPAQRLALECFNIKIRTNY